MSDDDSDVFGWTSEDRDDSPVVVSQPLARRDTSPLDQARSDRTSLPLLQLADWDEELPYDEQPPTCVHYSIEWKLTLNNRSISKDTEPNLVLAPGPYWTTFLRSKLEKLVDKKLPSNRSFSVDDTDIVVCVNDRGERDLTKRFDGLNIDWRVVERQLKTWSRLLLIGKRLRVTISFNYVETHQTSGIPTRGRGVRGATASQLAERAVEIEEEEAVSAQPAVWRRVYDLFRCTGSPCGIGPHCWVDTVGKKHYKLKTHHLRQLIKYVQLGNVLQSHDDVPPDVRDLLYAEEAQEISRKRKRRTSSSADSRPVSITNVMPPHSSRRSDSCDARPTSEPADTASQVPSYLGLTGMRDVNVTEYCTWHCSKVSNNVWKQEFQKACRLALEEGLDLEQIRMDQDADFFIEKGVKAGIARRWVNDVEIWFREEKALESE
ncbi:PKHD-type hydroxylase ofd1 [Verticillium dahliae VDG1]|nr:PKHD-type hydroxylase ofd1 [Verticillium dahliae VDG1]